MLYNRDTQTRRSGRVPLEQVLRQPGGGKRGHHQSLRHSRTTQSHENGQKGRRYSNLGAQGARANLCWLMWCTLAIFRPHHLSSPETLSPTELAWVTVQPPCSLGTSLFNMVREMQCFVNVCCVCVEFLKDLLVMPAWLKFSAWCECLLCLLCLPAYCVCDGTRILLEK